MCTQVAADALADMLSSVAVTRGMMPASSRRKALRANLKVCLCCVCVCGCVLVCVCVCVCARARALKLCCIFV